MPGFEDFMMFGLVSGLFPNPYEKKEYDPVFFDFFEYTMEQYLNDRLDSMTNFDD